MRRKPSADISPEKILADWRTGEFSVRKLATKHNVSVGYVGGIVKGVPKDLIETVDAGIKYRSGLMQCDEHSMNAVSSIVDAKTRHIAFFADATVKNVSLMMGKIGRKTSIDEHKTAQDAIHKGRETVLGKQPDTAIQINNSPQVILVDHSDE